jgi:hypothetical protein
MRLSFTLSGRLKPFPYRSSYQRLSSSLYSHSVYFPTVLTASNLYAATSFVPLRISSPCNSSDWKPLRGSTPRGISEDPFLLPETIRQVSCTAYPDCSALQRPGCERLLDTATATDLTFRPHGIVDVDPTGIHHLFDRGPKQHLLEATFFSCYDLHLTTALHYALRLTRTFLASVLRLTLFTDNIIWLMMRGRKIPDSLLSLAWFSASFVRKIPHVLSFD